MPDDQEYKPVNVETDSMYNREPGIVVIPGSNYANEMQKFEQFPSKYGQRPGNPYVKREFPQMVYRAQEWNGKVACMATQPSSADFADPQEFRRAEEQARIFTNACQRIVQDETELQRAFEDGFREDPETACDYLLARQRDRGTEAAHRNYEDRNMSDAAKAEKKAAQEDAGVHVPEGKPVSPVKKRRGRPPGSKNKPKR